MTDICAGIGLHQLAKLNMFNLKREKFAKIYDESFKNHPGFKIPVIKEYSNSSRHLYPLLLNLEYFKIERDSFIDVLKEYNVGTSVLFMPLHLHSYYKKSFGYSYGDFPISENIFDRIICLPISPKLSEDTINKVAETILYISEKIKK